MSVVIKIGLFIFQNIMFISLVADSEQTDR